MVAARPRRSRDDRRATDVSGRQSRTCTISGARAPGSASAATRPARTELACTMSTWGRRRARREILLAPEAMWSSPTVVCTGCRRRLASVPRMGSTHRSRADTALARGPGGHATTASTSRGRPLRRSRSDSSAPLMFPVWLTYRIRTAQQVAVWNGGDCPVEGLAGLAPHAVTQAPQARAAPATRDLTSQQAATVKVRLRSSLR
jgi:hypothetical protein